MTTLITIIALIFVVIGFRTIKATPFFVISILWVVITLTVGITHAHAGTTTVGSQKEYLLAKKQVERGIYINEIGTVVSKPSSDICNMYRSTYTQYQKEYGASKGARIWLVIITKRGC